MAYVMVDDLDGRALTPAHAHRVALTFDGDEALAWEHVAARPREELLAEIAWDLIARFAKRIDPDPDDHPEAAAEPEPEVAPQPGPDPTAAKPVESPKVTTAPAASPTAQASDAQVRRWATKWELPVSATGAIRPWIREEHTRLGGLSPDFAARRRARREGASPTVPSVAPRAARADVVAAWCLRNGVEDTGGHAPTADGRAAYAAAWAAHQPAAAGSAAADQDAPAPAPSAAGRAPAAANGHHVPAEGPTAPAADQPPAVEPVGDGGGTDQQKLDRAAELAIEGATPMQICDKTGVSLEHARAAVDAARKDRKR